MSAFREDACPHAATSPLPRMQAMFNDANEAAISRHEVTTASVHTAAGSGASALDRDRSITGGGVPSVASADCKMFAFAAGPMLDAFTAAITRYACSYAKPFAFPASIFLYKPKLNDAIEINTEKIIVRSRIIEKRYERKSVGFFRASSA
jgi:hypothetical protein